MHSQQITRLKYTRVSGHGGDVKYKTGLTRRTCAGIEYDVIILITDQKLEYLAYIYECLSRAKRQIFMICNTEDRVPPVMRKVNVTQDQLMKGRWLPKTLNI